MYRYIIEYGFIHIGRTFPLVRGKCVMDVYPRAEVAAWCALQTVRCMHVRFEVASLYASVTVLTVTACVLLFGSTQSGITRL